MSALAITADAVIVTEPGLYEMPETTYHADPVPAGSLSVSGAKKLLPPSCPALFDYYRTHPQPPKAEFDFGHAAHRKVLGIGLDVVEVEANGWKTKAAKAAAEEIRASGGVPLLTKDVATVNAMADALAAHPLAKVLFSPDLGLPEASLFWQDADTDVWRRGRLDFLPTPTDRRLILGDYKTAVCAEPGAFARAAANYGYHMQAAWYLDGVAALDLADDAAFVFVVQEKTAPYLVSIVELDAYALSVGRDRNREAIDTYLRCSEAGEWPGYSTDVELVSLPRWAA